MQHASTIALPQNSLGSGGLTRLRPSIENNSLVCWSGLNCKAWVLAVQMKAVNATKLVQFSTMPSSMTICLSRLSIFSSKVNALYSIGSFLYSLAVSEMSSISVNSWCANSIFGGCLAFWIERSIKGDIDNGSPLVVSAHECKNWTADNPSDMQWFTARPIENPPHLNLVTWTCHRGSHLVNQASNWVPLDQKLIQ